MESHLWKKNLKNLILKRQIHNPLLGYICCMSNSLCLKIVFDPLETLRKNNSSKNLKFELKTVTVKTVKRQMGKMRMKKSSGHDEISQDVLLKGKKILAFTHNQPRLLSSS